MAKPASAETKNASPDSQQITSLFKELQETDRKEKERQAEISISAFSTRGKGSQLTMDASMIDKLRKRESARQGAGGQTPFFQQNRASQKDTDPLTKWVLLIKAAKNNTHVHLSSYGTNSPFMFTTCAHVSAGSCKLRKAQRGTSDAGFQAGMKLLEVVKAKPADKRPEDGAHMHVIFRGFGPGRDQAFRAVRTAGWNITRITDDTPIRFGGCRARKKRRI